MCKPMNNNNMHSIYHLKTFHLQQFEHNNACEVVINDVLAWLL